MTIKIKNAIWSLNYKVTIDGKAMKLREARDAGLVDVDWDRWWNMYSYRVIKTGQVVSFWQDRSFSHLDHSEWFKEAIQKGPQEAQPHQSETEEHP